MEETLGEVAGSRSFDSLVKAVNTEKEKKAGLQQTILKYVLFMFGCTYQVCRLLNENNNYSLNTSIQFFPLSKHVLVSNHSVVASYQNYSKINLVNQKKN